MALPDKQIGKNKHFIQSARHALDGLRVFFVDENNFKREFVSATLVIIAGCCVDRFSDCGSCRHLCFWTAAVSAFEELVNVVSFTYRSLSRT